MMGIKSKLNGFCAETLGGLEDGVSPLEMASAYATIANGGYRNRPRAIKKIVRDGKTLKLPKRWRVHRVKAFEDGVTYEATKILEQNIQGGTGTHAAIGCPAGGKTGTTDKNIDAWFVGFTPRLSTAVWVGFPGDARRSMNGMYLGGRNIDGGTYPADIWGTYMKQAVGRTAATSSARPSRSTASRSRATTRARAARTTTKKSGDDQGDRHPRARHRDRARERHGAATAATPTAAGTTARPTTAARRQRRGVRPEPVRNPAAGRAPDRNPGRRHASARRRVAALTSDWYNLRRQGRPGGRRGSVREGSAPAAVLAHAGSRGVAVRWLPVS